MVFNRIIFRLYQHIETIDNSFRRKFTQSGHLFITLLVSAAVFGIDTNASTTYQLFVFLLIIILFAIVNTLFLRHEFKVIRRLPKYFTVGETCRYDVALQKISNSPTDAITIIDKLSDATVTPVDFCRNNGKPKWWVRYPEWYLKRLIKRGAKYPIQTLSLENLKTIQAKLQIVPLRRGLLQFSGFYIGVPDISGLYRKFVFVENEQSCFILPKQYALPSLNIQHGRKYQPGGLSMAASVGDSTEFVSLRDYRHGDPLKLIHWKYQAKQGKLVIKEFQDEYFMRTALMLDTFLQYQNENVFETAVSIAASIATQEKRNELLMDLLFAGKNIYQFTSGRGLDHLPHILEVLASVSHSREDCIAEIQYEMLSRAKLFSSLICIFLQWSPERQQLVKELQINGLEVAVFVIFDSEVDSPPFSTLNIKFFPIDCRNVEQSLQMIA